MKVLDLLLKMRSEQIHMSIVVDEFGGFVGLIGAEAVLNVLAGWWRKSKK